MQKINHYRNRERTLSVFIISIVVIFSLNIISQIAGGRDAALQTEFGFNRFYR